ncbi:unnamed protein product [Angiostrongylus costaricensis]|uniref:SnoaL-like domain-containing protein n=1 Tax=Angiostrongylus costaricensis TaxID=334426 RepID=A0A0R3PH59_ANGCS|nr:unnamed protein product [Angiostrongylus costaricensis]
MTTDGQKPLVTGFLGMSNVLQEDRGRDGQEFFTKSLEEEYDARRVPRASKTHWATLARDEKKWKIYWHPLESLDD